MKAERVKELARAAGWRDTPTVRDAFGGFDLYRFAKLVEDYTLKSVNPERAADMLTAYAEQIRRTRASDMEELHYLPQVEFQAKCLRELSDVF